MKRKVPATLFETGSKSLNLAGGGARTFTTTLLMPELCNPANLSVTA